MPSTLEFLPDGIIYIVADGDQCEDDVLETTSKVDEYIHVRNLKNINYLVDVSKLGQVTPGARKALRSRLKTIEYQGRVKYAMLGVSSAFTPLIQLFIKAVGTRSEFRFFKSRNKALTWLRE